MQVLGVLYVESAGVRGLVKGVQGLGVQYVEY